MVDKEYKDLCFYNLFLFLCYLFFPAICIFFIVFGYVMIDFIIVQIVFSILTVAFFVERTIFLLRYKKYNLSKKRFLFETLSFVGCFIFSISTAFLVKESDGVFSYYFLNIYIQPLFIIFTFVVMGHMASTAKRVGQIYVAEYQKRNPEHKLAFQKKNSYIGKEDYFEEKHWVDKK